MYVCMYYVCMCVGMYVCVYVCMYVFIYSGGYRFVDSTDEENKNVKRV